MALRVPDHAGARALLGAFGGPVVAPSANRSGYVSATTARHVAEDLGAAVSVILDGGQTGIGIESTVLDCTGDTVRILRPGAITRTALRACLGEGLSEGADTGGKVLAPGMLASHYAPNALVRLAAAEIAEGEAALTFGTARPAGWSTLSRYATCRATPTWKKQPPTCSPRCVISMRAGRGGSPSARSPIPA